MMSKTDSSIWIVVIVLLVIGLAVLYSASYYLAETRYGHATFFLSRQIIWSLAGLFVMAFLSRLKLQAVKNAAVPAFFVSILLAGVPVILHQTVSARRWIEIGFININTGLLAGVAFIPFLALVLASNNGASSKMPWLRIGVAMLLLCVALAAQPNMTPVTICLLVYVVMRFFSGLSMIRVSGILAIYGVLATLLTLVLGYKRARIDTFLESAYDPLLASYQVKESIVALGSGGFFGSGYLKGTAKFLFLPAPHTDFIASTIGEEFGFAGLLCLNGLYGFLIWRLYRIVIEADDLFTKYLLLGIISWFSLSVLLHMFVVTGMTPVMSVSLPFVSYSGTAMLLNCALIGLALSASRLSNSPSSCNTVAFRFLSHTSTIARTALSGVRSLSLKTAHAVHRNRRMIVRVISVLAALMTLIVGLFQMIRWVLGG